MSPNPSDELFKNYERHYCDTGASRSEAPLSDVIKFKLDRLPPWLCDIPKEARVLDAGCATGYFLALLKDAGYSDLTGIDISAQLAEKARKRLDKSAKIIVSDVQSYLNTTPDESFDLIFFHHVLEHIPREQTLEVLRGFYRCLRQGGLINIKTPNASYILSGNHMHGDFTHVTHFNERSMLQVLEGAGFESQKISFFLHPPKLFWLWHHPIRSILRLANHLRWHIHRLAHYSLCMLIDQHPTPKVFEAELDAIAKR